MKQISLTCLFIFLATVCFSQKKKCGFKIPKESKEVFMQELASAPIAERLSKASDSVCEIVVVFHIIFDGNSENISDERILRELNDLSRDFQLLNADVNNIPEPFKALVGNPKIKFRLATISPQGTSTTGIIRVAANRNVYTFNKPIFLADPVWDPQKYLNVYVGNIRNGKTRGYVNSYPWRNRSTDAIALHYIDVGNSTRLLTHEAGHWLGLWHITEGECSTLNDGIEDTPKQKSFTNGCPFSKSECSNQCMFPNYMDYSNCRVAFTNGQAKRIREILLMHRPNVYSCVQ